MKFNLLHTLLIALLCFPKIQISDNEGILIGEVLLIVLCLWNILRLRKNFFKLSLSLILLITFAFFYITFSNLILSQDLKSLLPFFRILIYVFGLNAILKRELNVFERLKSFVFINALSQLISISIFIYYYLITTPSLNDIIWGYELGQKLIPIYGLGLVSGFKLAAIGGGSGILIASSSLFSSIVLLKSNFRFKNFLITLNILSVILAQTRGGILVLLILYLYELFFKKQLNFKTIIISLIVVIGLSQFQFFQIFIGSSWKKLMFLSDMSNLDGSTMGRLENYSNLIQSFSNNLFEVIIGYGFESNLLNTRIDNNIVESFLLSIIGYGGLIAIFFFVVYLLSLIKNARSNQYLIAFYFWSGIILWSITGGDFFAVTTLTPTILSISK